MTQISQDLIQLVGAIAVCLHALGLISAVQAVFRARTSQGAIAWAIFLITCPYIALPLYWIFGRDRFQGYTTERQAQDQKVHPLRQKMSPFIAQSPLVETSVCRTFEGLAKMRFNEGNEVQLLINGDSTFEAIFKGIDSAKEYLLIQFFIVKDDELGRVFQKKVIEASKRGVRVYFLFDEIGSHLLPKHYIHDFRNAAVDIRAFKTTKGAKNRFQVNFRNHRKIVLVDGKTAFIGGHNVGDEYLGKDPKFGNWRDTHIRLEGPVVGQVQVSFLEDWHWSSGSIPDLNWEMEKSEIPGKAALIVATGPADPIDTCCLFFIEAINAAKKRIWIASPYFVPDLRIIAALQLAAMRGVQIQILLPNMADHLFVYLASFAFYKDTLPYNISIYRYHAGFLHQKIVLIDDAYCSVGTANFDNRSFRLNFEMTAVFADLPFSKEIEKMLVEDFSKSNRAEMADIENKSLFFRTAVHFAQLLAPIL